MPRDESWVIKRSPRGVNASRCVSGNTSCNVAVVTIDPARRLADALGLDHIGATASLIDGEWPGELSALMLDAESTFDLLVERYAASDAQALSILSNSFYRNISGTLSGTQEYMASEKLYELHQNEAYDLVVVDTPPRDRSRHSC